MSDKIPVRSWIANSRHHTQRIHPLNVKLTGEADAVLRRIAAEENLRLYEVIEKALLFYRQHHPGPTGED